MTKPFTFLLTWQEWMMAIVGAITATLALLALVPKMLATWRKLYIKLAVVVEISEILTRMEKVQRDGHQRLEDGLLNIIQTKRLVMDADNTHVFFEADAKGHFIWGNQRWHRITGLTHDAARGNGWENGIAPETKQTVIRDWMQAIDHQRAFESPVTYMDRATGARVTLNVAANPIRSTQGEVMSWLGVGSPVV